MHYSHFGEMIGLMSAFSSLEANVDVSSAKCTAVYRTLGVTAAIALICFLVVRRESFNCFLIEKSNINKTGNQPVVKDVAICVSGQIRTLETTITNITTNLLDTLNNYDIFMVVQTRESNLEPVAGDLSVCDQFKNERSDSSVLCSVTKEMALNTSAFLSEREKEMYFYSSNEYKIEGLLQQLVGLKSSFEMMETYSKLSGVSYKWVIRLRPDNWIPYPIPQLSSLKSQNILYFPSKKFRCCGNEDIFVIGGVNAMRLFMKRIDFMELDFAKELFNFSKGWTSENYVITLCSHFNISYIFHEELRIHVQRWPDASRNSNSQP